jgi:hypothetical protein
LGLLFFTERGDLGIERLFLFEQLLDACFGLTAERFDLSQPLLGLFSAQFGFDFGPQVPFFVQAQLGLGLSDAIPLRLFLCPQLVDGRVKILFVATERCQFCDDRLVGFFLRAKFGLSLFDRLALISFGLMQSFKFCLKLALLLGQPRSEATLVRASSSSTMRAFAS